MHADSIIFYFSRKLMVVCVCMSEREKDRAMELGKEKITWKLGKSICLVKRKRAHKMHRIADIVTCHGLLIRQCYIFLYTHTRSISLSFSFSIILFCVFAVCPSLVIIIPEHTHFLSITFVCIECVRVCVRVVCAKHAWTNFLYSVVQ